MRYGNLKSAYIHIPFCKQKCLYCDFNSFANYEEWIDNYMNALKEEIMDYSVGELYTTYIGGGTPSYVDARHIADILCLLPKSQETTIEMNPGTVTEEKLKVYREVGIDRISLGLQVAEDTILKEIGRIHTVKQFEEAYEMVRNVGFQNVNVDLMFGLPMQTLRNFKESVEYVIALKPEHISSYSLILHRPIFHNLPSDEEERAMYHYLVHRLREAGYIHYEISNFSFPGYESKHNLAYWKQREYYGFGAGASFFLDNKRYTNEENIEKYCSLISQKQEVRRLEETLDVESKIDEYMMLGLRLIEGVNIQETNEKFSIDVLKRYEKQIKKLKEQGLIQVDETIALTEKGLDFANIVWSEFLS